MIEIKDIKGHIRYTTPYTEGSIWKRELMKEDYILLKFSVEDPIYFQIGDYSINEFGWFEIVDLIYPTFNINTGGYDYELRLDAYYWKWKNKKLFYDRQSNRREAAWKLTRTPDSHLSIICSNLLSLGFNYYGTPFGFTVHDTVEKSAKLIEYNNTNIIDALTLIAQTWEAEWWIEGNIIHLGRCEYNTAIDFKVNDNVVEMSRNDSDSRYATRIYAFGSTRNIPTNYRPAEESTVVEGVVRKRLMLPAGTPYVDAHDNITIEEAIEDIVIFEDVYPKNESKISDLTTFEYTDTIENEDGSKTYEKWKAYRYKDKSMKFSKGYVIPGQELRIIFQTGSLNGMDFAVTFNPLNKPESEPEAQLWEIVRNEDYGISLPNDSIKPINGDKFVLYGFDISFVSDTMIPEAEQVLLSKARDYVEKSKIDPSIYTCKMDAYSMGGYNGEIIDLNIGDRVFLINPTFFPDGRQSRIYGFEKHLDYPCDVTYTVGESTQYSRLNDLESKLEELTYKGETFSGSGNGVYVVGRYDSTPASDRNVFSALRSLNEFLNKNRDGEIVQGFVRFLNDLFIGDNVIDSLQGGAGTIIDKNGRIQTRRLEVENSLTVLELIFNRLSAQEGNFSYSESGTIEDIEQIDATTYRLFLRKRWENDFTAFATHDISYGIVNNLASGSGEYYTSWFRIISVNTVANSLMVSLYPDTEVPGGKNYPPVKQMMITRRGNVINEERQGYWYVSSYEKCICMLDGVTKPILEENNYSIIIGRLKHLTIFDNLPINYLHTYIYCRGIAIQDILRIDYQGNPVRSENNRGKWSAIEAVSEPYKSNKETYDSVYHVGCKWMCLKSDTIQEPKWNATDWVQIEGNSELTLEFSSSNGIQFYSGKVDTVITPIVYWGYNDISSDILAGDWAWTRDSGMTTEDNAWAIGHANNGRILHLKNEDMPSNWGKTRKVKFTCTAYVRDGEYSNNVQNYINV